MRILILSDLHLEFRAPQPAEVCAACGTRYGLGKFNPGSAAPWTGVCDVCGATGEVSAPEDYGFLGNDWNLRLPDVDKYDVVVLAGDIHRHTRAVTWAAKTFQQPVIVLAGNHEYYDSHLHGLSVEMRRVAQDYPHVHLLDNSTVVLDGVRFIGATLWTDFQLFGVSMLHTAMTAAKRCMPDFSGAIRFGSTGYMLTGDSVKLFRVSKQYLRDELAKPFDGRTVVVTHHLPSMRSVATRFESDPMSAAFASNLDKLVEQADLWIHGHTHDSFEYDIGKCRVICNPRGYPLANGAYENPVFDAAKIVELDA